MQEEVEDRTVNLAISSTKLAGKEIFAAAEAALGEIKNHEEKVPTGKQTIKELVGQGKGVTNIDISKTDLKDFEKYARKYGIDYAITKDNSLQPPKYMVFFKGQDKDAMTAAFTEYTEKTMLNKDERPSVLTELAKMKERVAGLPARVKEKVQVR